MSYQLVLQWPALSNKDYDDLVEIEGALDKNLSRKHEVDGHDAGSGEMNIFIRTDDPIQAFEEIRLIFWSPDFWTSARIAYRDIDKSDYTILWPANLRKFQVT